MKFKGKEGWASGVEGACVYCGCDIQQCECPDPYEDRPAEEEERRNEEISTYDHCPYCGGLMAMVRNEEGWWSCPLCGGV